MSRYIYIHIMPELLELPSYYLIWRQTHCRAAMVHQRARRIPWFSLHHLDLWFYTTRALQVMPQLRWSACHGVANWRSCPQYWFIISPMIYNVCNMIYNVYYTTFSSTMIYNVYIMHACPISPMQVRLAFVANKGGFWCKTMQQRKSNHVL